MSLGYMGNFAGMVNLKFCSHGTGKYQIRKNANTQIHKNANTVCAQLKTHLEQELLNTQENLENILKFLQIPKFSTESSEHVPLNCSSKEENYQSSCLPCLPSQALVKYQITLENNPLC